MLSARVACHGAAPAGTAPSVTASSRLCTLHHGGTLSHSSLPAAVRSNEN